MQDDTPDWFSSRSGMQMREENPGGHPEESAGSGDKDLENRNTRGGAWSGDFKPSVSVLQWCLDWWQPALKTMNVTKGGATPKHNVKSLYLLTGETDR